MIRTWRGELPEWTPKFREHVRHLCSHGWDFITPQWSTLRARAKQKLNIDIPEPCETRKAGDYDPALGVLFDDVISDYDFWGHFNLDCVYGRLDRWLPDDFLCNIDIYANDPGAICGPFTVYRNTLVVNRLFEGVDRWREIMCDPKFHAFDEITFSKLVNAASLQGFIRFTSGFLQAHDHMTDSHWYAANNLAGLLPVYVTHDGTLMDTVTDREIMMYHFNQTRRWPLE